MRCCLALAVLLIHVQLVAARRLPLLDDYVSGSTPTVASQGTPMGTPEQPEPDMVSDDQIPPQSTPSASIPEERGPLEA